MKTAWFCAALAAFLALSGCQTTPSSSFPAAADIDAGRLSEMTRILASDEYEGRAPGSPGEARTIDYIVEQFRAAGMAPAGENGGWTQDVPLIRTRVQGSGRFALVRNGEARPLRFPEDIYVSTVRAVETARIDEAPLVFVGYGVSAPERGWDDFKDVDLKGKVAVFLVNDPDFEAEPKAAVAGRFGGRSMTYYGRWSYKFEEAARRGAVGALVIHETEGAGYGWNVIESPGGENYNIVRPADAAQPLLLQGWIQGPLARDLLRQAGHEFDAVKRLAQTEAFRPIPLGATFSADVPVTLERIMSRNVLGKIEGSRYPEETIMFAGHWDSFGSGAPDAQGRRIRPGAIDDAIGIAGLAEIGRSFARGPRPERTLVFAAWTAEERGLLGAEHYAVNPLFPLEKTVANLTLDVLQTAGAARDVILIGKGQSEMEDRLAAAARAQGRAVTLETHPERGLFFRADHFALAKKGVPVLLIMALAGGNDLVEGGRAAGEAWLKAYTDHCYHQPCDAWSADWDLRGAVQDIEVVRDIGRALAFSRDWPAWKEGSEFKGLREQSAAARRQAPRSGPWQRLAPAEPAKN